VKRVLLAFAGTASLSACRGRQSIFDTGGPAAARLAGLGSFILIVFGVVTVVMWALLVWAGWRRRGTLEDHEAPDAGGGQGWILVGGFIVPAVILAVVFVLGLRLLAAFPMDGGAHGGGPEIMVVGHQWWWEVHYVGGPVSSHLLTANEIHVPHGRPVEIGLATADVIHSFWVPGLHGKVDLIPGHQNRIRIEADRAGDYFGQCTQFCGAEHARMRLRLVADPPAQFQGWLARQESPALAPADDEAAHGQRLFLSHACVLCHTIRGTPAAGTVGPDLTHFASHEALAANSYPNDTAYLEAWVTHAQSLKPEAEMPDLAQFSGPELRALVTYLQGLK